MQSLILTLHIIVCVLLVILILLQSGKEGMGVIFGGGNTSVFGSTGAGGILVKLTTFMALVFVVTSLSYTYVTSAHQEKESTILDVKIEDVKPKADPLAPGAVVPAPQAPKVDGATNEKVINAPNNVSQDKNKIEATQDSKAKSGVNESGKESSGDAVKSGQDVKNAAGQGKSSQADVAKSEASKADQDKGKKSEKVKESQNNKSNKDGKDDKEKKDSKESKDK